jgi:hypothetical protein
MWYAGAGNILLYGSQNRIREIIAGFYIGEAAKSSKN